MDDQLTDELDTFQVNLNNTDLEGMVLLSNMEPFHLDQPLDLGDKSTYIGGLEGSVPLNFNRPGAEYALFSDTDDSNDDSDSNNECGLDM